MLRQYLRCLVWLGLAVFSAAPAFAQPPVNVVGVEEDWLLVLDTPDPLKASPQIITWMSPSDSCDDLHFGVALNHVQRPDFQSGGFQTKAMNGEAVIEERFSENGTNLAHNGETLTWTQRMLLSDGLLKFEVVNGTGQSWGTFGGVSSRVTLAASQLENLNQYNPLHSKTWSGVGYAANRVSKFQLKAVRLYTSDGNVFSVPLDDGDE